MAFSIDLALDCEAGWSFSSGHAQLTGRARNHLDGATTEVLQFHVAP